MHDMPLYPDLDREFLFSVIRAAFAHRRKTLRNSIARSRAGLSKDVMIRVFDAAQIDPGRRPQTLTLDEFVRLARAISREK
jgi:16S rRNA (adenine1518-N6/adenine1519-N6)-dimethyltransferase